MADLRAIIADDEAPLRRYLRRLLAEVWPELEICGEAGDSEEALQLVETEQPDIAFLDIKMPGRSGLELAEQIAAQCWVVFVTAYDEFAVDAFDKQAIDYLLKPVSAERLKKTVGRLKERHDLKAAPPPDLARLVREISRQSPDAQPEPLTWLKALHGEELRLISVDDVQYFRSSDKYTLVYTASEELILRTPIRQLAAELDAKHFWQIHRSIIVNARSIERVERDISGRWVVTLHGRPETLTASRSYAAVFRQM